jgi:predicted DNA-binding transcriptional regulator AlpA
MFALVNAGLRNTFPRQERLGLRSRWKHWLVSEPRL